MAWLKTYEQSRNYFFFKQDLTIAWNICSYNDDGVEMSGPLKYMHAHLRGGGGWQFSMSG